MTTNGHILGALSTDEAKEPEGYELVKFSCGHYRPKPANWPGPHQVRTSNSFAIQGLLDQVRRDLDTPWFESATIPGLDHPVRQAVMLCGACDADNREELGLPPAEPVRGAQRG
jgi:hypothetical protein